MVDLGHVSIEALRAALDRVETKKPTQRLTAAIAYKRGVTQTELASWYGVERKTIYNWLTRFESGSGSLEDAARDDVPAGRPRRLTDDQLHELYATVRGPPAEAGYDAPTWTPDLVGDFIRERWDVEYSRWSCLRFLKEAGLRYRPPAGAGSRQRDESRQASKAGASGWIPP